MLDPKRIISAEVVLASATGARIDEKTAVTAETIARYVPSPETVKRVTQYFRIAGFEVSPLGGVSLTISAPAEVFTRVFGTDLSEDERGGLQAATGKETVSQELPVRKLPKDIAPLVVAVTFVPPPEFGPVSFGP